MTNVQMGYIDIVVGELLVGVKANDWKIADMTLNII